MAVKGGGRRETSKRGETGEWIDLEAVQRLVHFMDEHRLLEVEIANGNARIRLVRDHAPGSAAAPITVVPGSGEAGVPTASGDAGPTLGRETAARSIISPMVGTFYRAPSPDAPPFVESGSVVEKGDTLCVIEAMKMMNEIEAEFRGRVTAVVAKNGQTVEYGEELFLVEPL